MMALGFRRLPSALKSTYDVNHSALQAYRPHPYSGKLVLFRATEQDYAAGPRDMGWQRLYPEGVEILEIPGDHERIFLEPAVDEPAKGITAMLNKELTA